MQNYISENHININHSLVGNWVDYSGKPMRIIPLIHAVYSLQLDQLGYFCICLIPPYIDCLACTGYNLSIAQTHTANC